MAVGTTAVHCSSSLTSDDLRPTTPGERTFTWADIAGLWIGLVVSVPGYYFAGSLVELGMAWWQGMLAIALGSTVLVLLLVLSAAPGTRYGVSFPVLARSAFGIRGAHVPTLLRALVACGWFGIETWMGGQALFLLFPPSVSSMWVGRTVPWLGFSALEFLCFSVFWVSQVLLIAWKGMAGIRELGRWSAPVLSLLLAALFYWAYTEAGGLGEMLSPAPRLPSSQFWAVFFPSVTATVGSWAAVATNVSDFSRYARGQRDQVLGQAGLPAYMCAFTFVGLAVTSSTVVIYGEPVSNPIHLISKIGSGGGVVGALLKLATLLGIGLAIVTTNVPANFVAPANALVNLSPSFFRFERAALAMAVAALAFRPWRILQSGGGFVTAWLVGYASVVGPISGVMLADYYCVRRMELDVSELYSDKPWGSHYYWRGFNPRAMVALAVPVGLLVPGFLKEVGLAKNVAGVFQVIYAVSWFFGFFSAGALYWAISLSFFSSPVKHRSTGKSQKEEEAQQILAVDSIIPDFTRSIQ